MAKKKRQVSWVEDDIEQEDLRPSKSAIKRQLAAVGELAKQLVELAPKQLDKLPLSDDAREALREAGAMQQRARQRQLRYASGVLANEDITAITAALAAQQKPHADEVRAMHDAEHWRDRLLAGDDSLTNELAQRFEELDARELRALVKQAQGEQKSAAAPRSARQLFRLLHRLRVAD